MVVFCHITFSPDAEWLNIKEPEPTKAITLQDINMFRVGTAH
jgi:hypothetical protein